MTMSPPTCSTRTAAAIRVAVIVAATTTARCVTIAARAHDENVEWVRLCTLTSNGSSEVNVTMPCGIHVQTESETEPLAEDGVPANRGGDADERENSNESNGSGDRWRFEKISQSTDDYAREPAPSGDRDGADEQLSDYYATVQDATVVQDDDDDGDGDDGTVHDDHEYRQQSTVKTVMFAYLLDAKNRLYNRIHYLLNALKSAFYKARLNRRSRRHSIERQIQFNDKRKPEDDKKKQSIVSVIMEPTFERSLMTMSFLMFGVFIIQVVQRLMQTMHRSGEIKSMVSSIVSSRL